MNGLRDEDWNKLLTFARERGPVWAVLVSVALTVVEVVAAALGWKPAQDQFLKYLAVAIGSSGMFVLLILIVWIVPRLTGPVRKRFTTKLEETVEYDLASQTHGTYNFLATQTIVFKALTEGQEHYQVGPPLAVDTLESFRCEDGRPKWLNKENLRGKRGVKVRLTVPVGKGRTGKVRTYWEYKGCTLERELKTRIWRDAKVLHIRVVLPPGHSRPQSCHWYTEDVDEGYRTGDTGITECTPYSQDRFCLSASFKPAWGYLQYAIVWS